MNYFPFFKMSCNGNDFIIVNNINLALDQVNDLSLFIQKVCCRNLSIGANGFIIVNKSKVSDFKWNFFNSDGTQADMCGNGAMCVAKYAYINNIANKNMTFETNVGVIEAEIIDSLVKVKMPEPKDVTLSNNFKLKNSNFILNIVNIGIPHAVILVNNIKDLDVITIGKDICNHSYFQPERINVNFVKIFNNNMILVRTYERGVEGETLSCGTGSAAAAIICAIKYNFKSPIFLNNRLGNKLKVYFERTENNFSNIYLKGDARVIYNGMLWKEGWDYL